MLPQVDTIKKIDRNKLIKSYGFVEQVSSNENFLKELLDLSVRVCEVPIAYISLLDEEKQYILSQSGIRIKTMNVNESICQLTIHSDSILEIEDTRAYPRVKDLPMVRKEEGKIVFYAGIPLVNADDITIGALCVMDFSTKKLTLLQKDCLRMLAKQIINTLDSQRELIKLIKNINSNFKPAVCSGINCLQGELAHLQEEVILQKQEIENQKKILTTSNKELTDFAHVLAHDVKAPLRTIGSFAKLIEKSLNGSCTTHQKECLGFIKKAVVSLDEMTTDLLSFAEVDKTVKKPTVFSFNAILEEVCLILLDTINEKKASINLPKEDFRIKGHKVQYIQLFQNLLSNGIKYQPENNTPILTIETVKEGEKVLVSVIDNGIGILEEDLQLIFKPFKRLHSRDQYNGSGIGLATCTKILESLQSEFNVTSQIGKGTIFSFHLPLAE